MIEMSAKAKSGLMQCNKGDRYSITCFLTEPIYDFPPQIGRPGWRPVTYFTLTDRGHADR